MVSINVWGVRRRGGANVNRDELLDTLSGPLKLPAENPRAMENPMSALFDLSEQVSEKSLPIKRNVWYSLLFVVLWTGFSIAAALATFVNREPLAVIIFILLTLSGLYTARIIIFNYRFFDYFYKRYSAIKLVREGNPNLYVPKGDSPVERYLNHLRANYRPFSQLLDAHPETIQFSAIIRGHSGGAYQFDAYISIPGNSPMLRRVPIPQKLVKRGYALFIKVFDTQPTLKDISILEDTVRDITALTCLPPRVVVLHEGGDGELPEDLYRHITDEGATASCRKGTYPYNVQVVSGVEGTYDLVPLISSEGLP